MCVSVCIIENFKFISEFDTPSPPTTPPTPCIQTYFSLVINKCYENAVFNQYISDTKFCISILSEPIPYFPSLPFNPFAFPCFPPPPHAHTLGAENLVQFKMSRFY